MFNGFEYMFCMIRFFAVKKISHHKGTAGKMESEQYFVRTFAAEYSVHFSNSCIWEFI